MNLQIDFIYVIIASRKNGCNKKAHLAEVQIGRSSYGERAAYVSLVYTDSSDRCFQELDDQLVHAVCAAALLDESILQLYQSLNHDAVFLIAQIEIPLFLSEHHHQPPSAVILCLMPGYGKCAISKHFTVDSLL